MIVVHVDVAVGMEKHIQKMLCMVYGPACVPACLFKMSTVVCEYMFHLDGHYTKAQRLSMTISVATQEKLKQGVIVIVLGNVRGEITL